MGAGMAGLRSAGTGFAGDVACKCAGVHPTSGRTGISPFPAHLIRVADRVRAAAWATLFTLLLVAAIVVGSRNLENFDPALVIYTFAIIFATWGVVYHYNVWLDKPPTRMYWRRGWELFRSQGMIRPGLRSSD